MHCYDLYKVRTLNCIISTIGQTQSIVLHIFYTCRSTIHKSLYIGMALVMIELHCEFLLKGKAVSELAIYSSVKDTHWEYFIYNYYECAVGIARHLK